MSDQTPQTRSNHTRLDPAFHFFLVPAVLLYLVWTIIHLVRHPAPDSLALFGIAIVLFVMTYKFRTYSLKVQDRVIRLEERLRLATLVSDPLRSRIPELTESQLIGLRFASDAELPGLMERALNEKLDRKQIKAAIVNWRGDYWRV